MKLPIMCNTGDCFSASVGKSTASGNPHCVECCIKIMRMSGPGSVTTLPGAKFPWDQPADATCPTCGMDYNIYVLGHTCECPSCRNDVDAPDYEKLKNSKPQIPLPEDFVNGDVKYEEGPHD